MFFDLSISASVFPAHQFYDFVVIGAGPAGIYLAKKLSSSIRPGSKILLLDAGGHQSSTFNDLVESQRDYFSVSQVGSIYKGSSLGRSFGIGGTSSQWGGQMLSLRHEDFAARFNPFSSWPISFSDLEKHYESVLSDLSLHSLSSETSNDIIAKYYSKLSSFQDCFDLRLSQWIPFSKRNFKQVYFDQLLSSGDSVDIVINSQAMYFSFERNDNNLNVSTLHCEGLNGQSFNVKGSNFIITSGAIESTRLLLLLRRSISPQDSFLPSLGCYFSDHVSTSVASLKVDHIDSYSSAVAPFFDGDIMRTPRLEVSHHILKSRNIMPAFVHFTFMTDGNSGFDTVRSILRSRQGFKFSTSLNISNVFSAARDAVKLGKSKYIDNRLWFPPDADFLLQVDVEQAPNISSRLYLSEHKSDSGQYPLFLDWRISRDDIDSLKSTTDLLKSSWSSSELAEYSTPDFYDGDFSPSNLYDVYHPIGSMRMGVNPSTSVVSPDLKVWGFSNLYASSTAVFPSMACANPGLTHLALTHRLFSHLTCN